jgi:hypothetical protein
MDKLTASILLRNGDNDEVDAANGFGDGDGGRASFSGQI